MVVTREQPADATLQALSYSGNKLAYRLVMMIGPLITPGLLMHLVTCKALVMRVLYFHPRDISTSSERYETHGQHWPREILQRLLWPLS